MKNLIDSYRQALESRNLEDLKNSLAPLFATDAKLHICQPFGDMIGSEALVEKVYQPLIKAFPDCEPRDMIVMAGTTEKEQNWVGTMGNYMGTFLQPFLGIPPNGKLCHMRYHEFFRMEHNKIAEIQAIWDIPELMMQANAWPLAPQLGSFLATPAPMSQDGLRISGDGSEAKKLVQEMIHNLCLHPSNPDPKIMQLEKFWHPQCNWYGPAGIGSTRGISGFRNYHQIPFLRAMPDRKVDKDAEFYSHWFAEGNYVCETGWPNMRLSITGDGWLGIAPAGQEVHLRSLDFWRLENGLIRENWVLIDLIDMYQQIGIDVFTRLGDFNKARNCIQGNELC